MLVHLKRAVVAVLVVYLDDKKIAESGLREPTRSKQEVIIITDKVPPCSIQRALGRRKNDAGYLRGGT